MNVYQHQNWHLKVSKFISDFHVARIWCKNYFYLSWICWVDKNDL